MKSKDIWNSSGLIFTMAAILLAPYFFGLYPAIYTLDTSFYISTFLEGTRFCTAPATESRLFRCVLQGLYSLDPSYGLYSLVKLILACAVTVYFSKVLAKIKPAMRFLALLPLLYPYFGMYIMLDERDVFFDLLLATLFIRLLDNPKSLVKPVAIMILMILIRDDGLLQSGIVLLYFLTEAELTAKAKKAVLAVLLVSFGVFGFKILHSHKLRYSLMAPAIIIANSGETPEDAELAKQLQACFAKSKVIDPQLQLEYPESIARATKIMFENCEIPHPSSSALEFNKLALKLILKEPVMFLKIRAALFKSALYDRVFGLEAYHARIARWSTGTHGGEFFTAHLKPHLPANGIFNVLAGLDSAIAGAANSILGALFFTPLLALLIALFALANYKKMKIAAVAGICFAARALMSFLLAPDTSGKYLYSMLFVSLFVAVIAAAEKVKANGLNR